MRPALTASVVLGLVVLAVSCGTVPPRSTDSTVMPVFYATDRKPLMPLEVWQAKLTRKGSRLAYYGAEYVPGRLELGVCPINVPIARHKTGRLESPAWNRPVERPELHFAITTLQPLEPDAFFAALNHRLTNSACPEVAVFIHGYNLTFTKAALYASQLSWDWDFRGVPILYSWPSQGTLLAYPRDEESADLTETHLRNFLQGILTRTVATNVHLIAHSLGCRTLTEVLRTFVAETNQPLFGQVVLAAPDVNRVGFMQDVAQTLPRLARHVTLYVSSSDKALGASRSLHQYARAGDAGPELALCQGIDTIDASEVDAGALGHSYLVKAPTVIADIADVLCRGLPPEQRNLTRSSSNGLVYWKLNRAKPAGDGKR